MRRADIYVAIFLQWLGIESWMEILSRVLVVLRHQMNTRCWINFNVFLYNILSMRDLGGAGIMHSGRRFNFLKVAGCQWYFPGHLFNFKSRCGQLWALPFTDIIFYRISISCKATQFVLDIRRAKILTLHCSAHILILLQANASASQIRNSTGKILKDKNSSISQIAR
jgi:hypothetical protein